MELGMRGAIFGLLLAATGGASHAQTLSYPSDYLTEAHRMPFRVCRAAILIEAGVAEGDRTVLPPAMISAMREQVAFIMHETIFNVPAISMADGTKRLDFTEQFVIDFGKTIGTEMKRLKDPAKRGQALIDCQPILWEIMKQNIDVLIKWRMRAMGLETPFPMVEGLPAVPQ